MAKKGLPIVAITVSFIAGAITLILLQRQGIISTRHSTSSDQGGVRPNVRTYPYRHFPLTAGNFN